MNKLILSILILLGCKKPPEKNFAIFGMNKNFNTGQVGFLLIGPGFATRREAIETYKGFFDGTLLRLKTGDGRYIYNFDPDLKPTNVTCYENWNEEMERTFDDECLLYSKNQELKENAILAVLKIMRDRYKSRIVHCPEVEKNSHGVHVWENGNTSVY